MIKKVCKDCRIFVKGDQCPLCNGTNLSESWRGKLYVLNPEKSTIAKKLEIKVKGEYSIKAR